MNRTWQYANETFQIRPAHPDDDPALREMMQAHVLLDSGWPPAYARASDLAEWLGSVAGIARWIVLDSAERTVGHAGLGPVKTGENREALQAALACGTADMAEICRMVIHPDVRGNGLAGILTRVALRGAIEAGLYPVSNVLSNRGSWLEMMLATGWREVCRTPSQVSDCDLVALLPPERFVDAVREHRSSRP